MTGADGRRIGYEVQLSAISSGAVDRRTRTAQSDGLTPMWLVNDANAMPIDRAPWLRIVTRDWMANGLKRLRIGGGVRSLAMVQCERLRTRCPVKGYGYCADSHPMWNVATDLIYDDIIRKTGNGELVSVHRPSTRQGRLGSYMWVTPTDRDRYRATVEESSPDDDQVSEVKRRPSAAHTAQKARDPNCHYREDSGYRQARIEARDAGEPYVAFELLGNRGAVSSTVRVDGYEISVGLIHLRRDFDAACAFERKFWAQAPSANQTLAGMRLTEAQLTELADVRREQVRLAVAINSHPWPASVRNRAAGGFAVAKAARLG